MSRAYYPTTSCFTGTVTTLKKRSTICDYCYSCYLELCDNLSKWYNIPVFEYGVLRKNCLEYLNNNLDKSKYSVYDKNAFFKHVSIVEDIVIILNKYTKYSNTEKEGHNLLHKGFIDSLMEPLDILVIGKYCWSGDCVFYTNSNEKKLKFNSLYNLNIICLESYGDSLTKRKGGVYKSVIKIYEMAKER